MSTTIKYKDSNGEFITNQQASLLSDYIKLYYVNDELKKEEEFFDNEPFGGTYHLSTGEDALALLDQLDSQFKWSFSTHKVINGYVIYELKSYDDNLQLNTVYHKEVRDLNDNFVAIIKYNTQTNQVIGAFKVFRFREDEEITFSFNDDGSIKEITISNMVLSNEMSYTDLSVFITEINEFIGDFITQEQLDYFTDVEALVPSF